MLLLKILERKPIGSAWLNIRHTVRKHFEKTGSPFKRVVLINRFGLDAEAL